MDILQKIREIYPSLTRKQKSIADYLLEIRKISAILPCSAEPADLCLGAYSAALLRQAWLLRLPGTEAGIPRAHPADDPTFVSSRLLCAGKRF